MECSIGLDLAGLFPWGFYYLSSYLGRTKVQCYRGFSDSESPVHNINSYTHASDQLP